MASNDPFDRADLERTIIVPMPGGRGRSPPPPRMPDATVTSFAPSAAAGTDSGLNPLVAAANPLLRLIPQLRATTAHADPTALREQLIAALRNFEDQARAHGVESHKIRGATYALATLLDETIASTPWGSSGAWAQQSLLVLFHNESWGGEKFFQLLARLAENVPANRDLLELLYACLALGFEGRYRVIDNGRTQLDAVRQRLAELLRKHSGEYERALSPHWQGKATTKKSDWAAAPLWIGVALIAVLLLGGISARAQSAPHRIRPRVRANHIDTGQRAATPRATARAEAPSGNVSRARNQRRVGGTARRQSFQRDHNSRRRAVRLRVCDRCGSVCAAARTDRARAGCGPRPRGGAGPY